MSSASVPAEAVGLVVGVLVYSVICLCTSLLLYVALNTLREYTNCTLYHSSIEIRNVIKLFCENAQECLTYSDRCNVIGGLYFDINSGFYLTTDRVFHQLEKNQGERISGIDIQSL